MLGKPGVGPYALMSMQFIQTFVDIFLHLDRHLVEWTQQMGHGIYFVLFAVVFCETGLVVTPFLPGDSLMFAVGALVALPETGLSLPGMMLLLIAAALLGDCTNYWIGSRVGGRLLERAASGSSLIRQEHIQKTRDFYSRYGAKTVVIARFVPIVRTFAPFVAGLGTMPFRRFIGYSCLGAVLWVCGLMAAGHAFGNLPEIRRNFQWVILAIIAISVMPIAIEVLRSRSRQRKAGLR